MLDTRTALELGYFIGEDEEATLNDLMGTLDDGVIMPSLWEVVDENGEPASVLDALIGCTEFVSFTEISSSGLRELETRPYGIGFSQAFLAAQEVDQVTYIPAPGEGMWPDRETLIRDGLEDLLANWDSLQYLRKQTSTALRTLREDPEKRAIVHQMIVEQANNTRTYYELVPVDALPEDGAPESVEWRTTEPVHFTLGDVQTIYVRTMDDVVTLRNRYPAYGGVYVVLG